MPTKEQPVNARVVIEAQTPQAVGAKKVRIPVRVCHLGSFSGDRPRDFQEAGPQTVSARNLGALAEALRPTFSGEVDDLLSGDAERKLPVQVEFTTLPREWPRQIIEQCEPLRRLAEAIEGLRLLKMRLMVDRRKVFEGRVRQLLAAERGELQRLLEHFTATDSPNRKGDAQ